MEPLLLVAAAGDGVPFWWTAAKDVAIPVLGAGAILYWVGTKLLEILRQLLAALMDNTKATVDFTASQREHTATMVALKAEVTAALASLRGSVAEVEKDVESLERGVESLSGPIREIGREITGKQIVPTEFRALSGGKKEGG